MNSESYFGSLTTAAKELTALEKRGGPIPAKFDFAVEEVCARCMQDIKFPKKIFRCATCKAVIYCSAEVRRSKIQGIIGMQFKYHLVRKPSLE